jgi:hypothetical protein
MSKVPVKSWKIVCDWPECKDEFEYDMYSVFGDGWDECELIDDSNWRQSADGEKHYCSKHPCQWASDLADGYDEEPERPYLLIHDGDTDDSDDDGFVTLIEPRNGSVESRETVALDTFPAIPGMTEVKQKDVYAVVATTHFYGDGCYPAHKEPA